MACCKNSTVQTKMLCENVSLRLNKNTVSKPDTFYECLEIELDCSKQFYYIHKISVVQFSSPNS